MLVRTGSPYHPLPSQLNLQFSTFSPVRFHAVMISLSRHQVLFDQNRMCNRFPKPSAVQTTSKQLVNDLRCASSCSSESKVLDERESRGNFFSESAMVYPRKLPGPRRALARQPYCPAMQFPGSSYGLRFSIRTSKQSLSKE